MVKSIYIIKYISVSNNNRKFHRFCFICKLPWVLIVANGGLLLRYGLRYLFFWIPLNMAVIILLQKDFLLHGNFWVGGVCRGETTRSRVKANIKLISLYLSHLHLLLPGNQMLLNRTKFSLGR